MAAEVSTMPGVNGNYAPHQGYGGIDQQQQQNTNAYINNTTSSATVYGQVPPSASSTPAPNASGQQTDVPKDEVGWYFVEQYYTTLSRSPEKLYLFYAKRSQFVSGMETDKVEVCVGQRAINDRIKELDFQDCKVRVTNVDSQASDQNIVIQVIGEISNKGQPHKKFTQTFVLATQTNGYFVLNDIFRYLIEEEDEPEADTEAATQQQDEQDVQQAVPAAESGYEEPPPTAQADSAEPKTLTSSTDPAAIERDAAAVDKELEQKAVKNEEPPAAVNGVAEPEEAEANHVGEDEAEAAPAAAAAPAEEEKVEEPAAAEEEPQPEKPQDPVPSPAPTPAQQPPPQQPQQPSAPSKPAAPKTWASLAASAHRVATPAAPPAPSTTTGQSRPAPPAAKRSPAPPSAASQQAPSAPAQTAPAAAREEPEANGQQDEWTAVGSNHTRQPSRQTNGQQDQGAQSRGYIKNVHEGYDFKELEQHLAQFGELTYFDIARQKNCAFVDFKSPEGYSAAVAANPHTLGADRFYVEERRIRPGSAPYVPRGSFQGGRGRGNMGQGAPRGGFGRGRGDFPARGGRGGAPANRGRGGIPSAL